MTIRLLLCTILILVFANISFSQTGAIKGVVTTSDGKQAGYVTITLKGSAKSVTANAKGEYEIKKAAPGNYTIIASYVGHITQTKEVTVIENITTTVDFVLAESKAQLQEVIVKSSLHSITDKSSDMVARMPLKNLENPQVYSVVGKELMKEQMMTDIREPFKAAAGVTATEYVTGSFAASFRGFTNFDYARNGLATSVYRSGTEIANLERIELIKGPSGTLFGAAVSSFGGVMNLVTKKPYAGFGGEAGYSAGSFDLSRASVDINTPLNKDKTVLFRFNAVKHSQNSSNEYGRTKRFMVAPSLLYQANDRLSFQFDYEYFKSNATRLPFTLLFADEVPFASTKEIPLGFRKSFFANDLISDAEATKYFGQMKYQLSNTWTSTTSFSNVNEFLDKSYQPYVNWAGKDTALVSVRLFGPRERTSANVQQNFNGTFYTKKIKHNFLAGASFEYQNETVVYRSTPDFKIGVNGPFNQLRKAKVDSVFNANPSGASDDKYGGHSLGIYLSDVIYPTSRLSALVSLRFDRFEQMYAGGYVQPSCTPKFGIVYQLVKNQVSVFGNYMSGFQNQGTSEQPDGSIFKPTPVFAKQLEGGVKFELYGNKISGSVSYYNIAIDNAIRTGNEGFLLQDGKQVSKGVEIELIANPFAGLNIVTGYAFNENKFIKADLYEGKLSTDAPQNTFNYWVSYRMPENLVKGLGLGFGGNYVSESYFNSSNTYSIPAYHVLSATAFYDRTSWRFGLKLNNITNQEYWDMKGSPMFTRNFVASVTFRF